MVVFRTDPCGIICFVVTYIAIFYADYVVVVHMVVPTMSDTLWGAVHTLIFNIFIFLMTVSHCRAVFSDPGIVPLPTTGIDFSDMHSGQKKKLLDKEKTPLGWTVCMRCETYRPPRAHHCRICRRCVRRMDHHCPWINNCVGEFNQKFFIQFLVYVGAACLYAVSLCIAAWVIDPHGPGGNKHTRVLHTVVLVVECILFGIFVIAIGCDQMSAILSDETLVEQVKKEGTRRPQKSSMALMAEVFGRGHPGLWLCPFEFQSNKQQDIPRQYDV